MNGGGSKRVHSDILHMMMVYKNTYCGSRLNKMPMLVGIECVLTINPFMGNEISQTPEYVSAYFAFI